MQLSTAVYPGSPHSSCTQAQGTSQQASMILILGNAHHFRDKGPLLTSVMQNLGRFGAGGETLPPDHHLRAHAGYRCYKYTGGAILKRGGIPCEGTCTTWLRLTYRQFTRSSNAGFAHLMPQSHAARLISESRVAGFLKPYLTARLENRVGDKTVLLYTVRLKCMCGHMACLAAWAP